MVTTVTMVQNPSVVSRVERRVTKVVSVRTNLTTTVRKVTNRNIKNFGVLFIRTMSISVVNQYHVRICVRCLMLRNAFNL